MREARAATPQSSSGSRLAATVVVPTRNRGDLIEETVAAILASEYADFELLVVDQSTDGRTRAAVERVANGDRRVRYVETATVGSSAARNVGARSSSADLVLYTDDDCIVAPGWLGAVLEAFEDPEVSAVYGRLLPYNFDGRTGTEVGFKPSTEGGRYRGRTPPWYIGHGGNMAFRRAPLLALGGFDEYLGAGGRFGACEDPDMAYRMLARGLTVAYSPSALAYHKHWKDWPAQQRMERAYGVGAGAQFAKYIRCGDAYGFRLLAAWIWQLGVRRTGAGLLKWRNPKTVYLGYCQLIYPWVGVVRSLRQPVRADLVQYSER